MTRFHVPLSVVLFVCLFAKLSGAQSGAFEKADEAEQRTRDGWKASERAERYTYGSRQDAHAKIEDWARRCFAPGAFASPVISAVFVMASPPRRYAGDWHTGVNGFAHLAGDGVFESMSNRTVATSVSLIVREDLRYVRSRHGYALGRAADSLKEVLLDRSDSGHVRFALSQMAGAVAGAVAYTAVQPATLRNRSHGVQSFLLNLAGMGGQNLVAEFSPELRVAGGRCREGGKRVVRWMGARR